MANDVFIDSNDTMDIKQEEEVEIKREELIVKEEYIPLPELDTPTTENVGKESSYATQAISAIKKHLKKHTDGTYQCNHCDFKTLYKYCFLRHQSKCAISDQRKYFCANCPYTTKSKQRLRSHVKIHSKFASEQCEDNSRKKFVLQHLFVHNAEKPYQCKVCDYKTTERISMEQHLSLHGGEKPYCCKLCDYKTKTKWQLLRHLKVHSAENLYHCTLCEFKTVQKQKLKEHHLSHGEKPYQCKQCNYKTGQRANLKQHLVLHTGEKPYQCKLCDYRTAQRTNLRLHLFKHSGKTPHCCTLCDYKTTTKWQLDRHLAVHSGEKSHHCTLCNYKTRHKQRFDEHLLRHTGEKPYSCELCDYKTRTNWQLKRHHRKVHILMEKVCTTDSCNEDTKNSKHFVFAPEILPEQRLTCSVIKEELIDLVL